MTLKELKVKYKKKLIHKSHKENAHEETFPYLNRAAKVKFKISSKNKINCLKCNGVGYLRITLDEARTCLNCYGKGFLMEEVKKF